MQKFRNRKKCDHLSHARTGKGAKPYNILPSDHYLSFIPYDDGEWTRMRLYKSQTQLAKSKFPNTYTYLLENKIERSWEQQKHGKMIQAQRLVRVRKPTKTTTFLDQQNTNSTLQNNRGFFCSNEHGYHFQHKYSEGSKLRFKEIFK